MTRRYRYELTLPEKLIWVRLRARPHGLVFRRQHRFDLLQLDFFCPERAWAIEIDGIDHDMGDRPERDISRDAWLETQGIETIRITASEVLRSADDAAEAIVRFALSRPRAFNAPRKRKRTNPSDGLRPPPPHRDGEE